MRYGLLLLTISVFLSCQPKASGDFRTYDLGLSTQDQKELLHPFLESRDYDYNFALFDQISRTIEPEHQSMLMLLITDYLKSHEEDPYQAYYLLRIALYYQSMKAEEVSRIYLNRLVNNTEDLIIKGQSIHLTALNQLLSMAMTVEDKITIYESLISRFPDKVDLGQCHYFLGHSYEQMGQWDRAYEEYNVFLQYRGTEIPGVVNGYEMVRQRVNFHNSRKNWTFETRDALVNSIKYAISSRKIYLLNNYRSSDFFVLSWSQKMEDYHQISNMDDISNYSHTSLRYNRDLEPYSNDNEAYLKTWGWSYRVKSWYLYFRRIDYPADPEINGRWEWAGIYLGDPL